MRFLLIAASESMLETAIRLHWGDAHVTHCDNADAALSPFLRDRPDLVLVDRQPGQGATLAALAAIRRISDVPVIALCPSGNELEEIRCLEAGADDCVNASSSPLVMIARIRAVLRRHGGHLAPEAIPDLRCGDLHISSRRHEVLVNGHEVRLTPLEFRLLAVLARNAGRVLSHRMLIDRAWGTEAVATPAHLKVIMSRLRRKLEERSSVCIVQGVRGVGYRLLVLDDSIPVPVTSPLAVNCIA